MVLKSYGFENGVDEATVVATDPTGTADDADLIEIVAGGEVKYDSAKSGARGVMAMRFASGATSGSSRWRWNYTNDLLYARCYVHLVAASWLNTNEIIKYMVSAGTRLAGVRINASRVPQLVNNAGTNVAAGTALAADAWHRVELKVDIAGGSAELRIYSGADLHGTTATQTIGPTASTYGSAGTGDVVSFGIATNGSNIGPGWMDEIAVSDAGWIGAAADPTAPPSPIKSNAFENTLAEDTQLTPANSGYTVNAALDDVFGAVTMKTRSIGGSRYASIVAAESTSVDNIAGFEWNVDGEDVVLDARILTTWPKASYTLFEASSKQGRPCYRVVLLPTGFLQVRDRHNTVLGTSAVAMPDGDWWRLRVRSYIHATTPASNILRIAYFTPVDAAASTETINYNGADLGPPGRKIRFTRVGVLSPSRVSNSIGVDAAAVSDAGVPAAPTITSFDSPVPIGGTVNVIGDNYASATGFKFAGSGSTFVNGLFTLTDDEHISAVVPPGAVTGKITIQTAGGEVQSATDLVVSAAITDVVPTDVTPGTGFNDANVAAYEGGNAIPEMTFELGFVYDITITAWHSLSSAEIPVPETVGLTWEPVQTYQSGTNAMSTYRCRPASAITATTRVAFTKEHQGLQWNVTKYDNFDGSGTNGDAAIGVVGTPQSATNVARADFNLPGFTVARKNLHVAVLQNNVAESVAAVSPAVGLGQAISTLNPPTAGIRTLKKVAVIDDDDVAATWTTPTSYRGYDFEIMSGSGTGTGGGGGGGGGEDWVPPEPNTDPNPTANLTLTAPMTADAVNAAISGISGGPIGKCVKFVGTFDFNKAIKTYDNMTLCGTVGTPARFKASPYGEEGVRTGSTKPNAYAFQGKDDASVGVTISDLRIDGWSQRGIIPFTRWTIRRCEVDHCFQNGVGGSYDHTQVRITFDTCHIHHNGNWQHVGDTPGGAKFLGTGKCGNALGTGINFLSCEVDHNIGPGLWWDHTCAGDTMYGCYTHDNTRTGARYEICAGPTEWRGNRVEYNGLTRSGHTYGYDDSTPSQFVVAGVIGGFNITSAAYTRVISNTFLGNAQKAITYQEEERAILTCAEVGGAKRGYFFIDHQVLGNILNGGGVSTQVTSHPDVHYDPTPL